MEERRHTGRNIDGEGEPQQCRTVVSGVAAVAVETADGRGSAEGGDEDVGRFEVSVYDTFGIERPVHFGHALQQTAEDGGSVTVEVGADEIGEPEGAGREPFEQKVGTLRGSRTVEEEHLFVQVFVGGDEEPFTAFGKGMFLCVTAQARILAEGEPEQTGRTVGFRLEIRRFRRDGEAGYAVCVRDGGCPGEPAEPSLRMEQAFGDGGYGRTRSRHITKEELAVPMASMAKSSSTGQL